MLGLKLNYVSKRALGDMLALLATGRYGWNFKSATFEHMLRIKFTGTCCEIVL